MRVKFGGIISFKGIMKIGENGGLSLEKVNFYVGL